MPQKQQLSFRVPPDTYQEFEAYRQEREISKTDAGRRLLEDALHDTSTDTDASREPGRRFDLLLGVALGLLFAVVGLAVALGGVRAAAVVGGAALLGVGLTPILFRVR